MDQGSPGQVVGSSRFDIVQITLHNITVLSQGQKSGRVSRLAVFDISLRHDGARDYSLDNLSLVCFESDHDQAHRLYPETSYFQETGENPLLPCTLIPGLEKRGTVVCPILENVDSMVLYIRDRDWTIGGELVIPEIVNGSQGNSDSGYPKNLGLIVHSAVQRRSIPGTGKNLVSGHKVAIINVSITNYNPSEVRIRRENLFILTEGDTTYEHGGERVEPEIARQYLRFPLVIPPGETKSGPILYYVSSTRINRLVLTDRNFVINSIVDLNGIYRYE
jgi:hypothetical protein